MRRFLFWVFLVFVVAFVGLALELTLDHGPSKVDPQTFECLGCGKVFNSAKEPTRSTSYYLQVQVWQGNGDTPQGYIETLKDRSTGKVLETRWKDSKGNVVQTDPPEPQYEQLSPGSKDVEPIFEAVEALEDFKENAEVIKKYVELRQQGYGHTRATLQGYISTVFGLADKASATEFAFDLVKGSTTGFKDLDDLTQQINSLIEKRSKFNVAAMPKPPIISVDDLVDPERRAEVRKQLDLYKRKVEAYQEHLLKWDDYFDRLENELKAKYEFFFNSKYSDSFAVFQTQYNDGSFILKREELSQAIGKLEEVVDFNQEQINKVTDQWEQEGKPNSERVLTNISGIVDWLDKTPKTEPNPSSQNGEKSSAFLPFDIVLFPPNKLEETSSEVNDPLTKTTPADQKPTSPSDSSSASNTSEDQKSKSRLIYLYMQVTPTQAFDVYQDKETGEVSKVPVVTPESKGEDNSIEPGNDPEANPPQNEEKPSEKVHIFQGKRSEIQDEQNPPPNLKICLPSVNGSTLCVGPRSNWLDDHKEGLLSCFRANPGRDCKYRINAKYVDSPPNENWQPDPRVAAIRRIVPEICFISDCQRPDKDVNFDEKAFNPVLYKMLKKVEECLSAKCQNQEVENENKPKLDLNVCPENRPTCLIERNRSSSIGGGLSGSGFISKPLVAVSWDNFQEERWRADEAAIKAALTADGADYISADAQSSAEKQLTDIDSLIARGAKALIILAHDKDAIGSAIEKAKAARIPVISYNRLIEDPYVFYLAFDNVEVGRIMGHAVLAAKPRGNYVFIRGDPGDPNATFVYNGQREILEPAIKAGRIKVVGEQATEGWKPDEAQRNMEQLLTRNANRIDAVMSSNDGMATGSAAALQAVGLLGKAALSGQDGDQAALNRVALGQQTVSVWKDSRALGKAAGEIAVALIKGTAVTAITAVGVKASVFDGGPKKVKMNAILLKPVGITRNNLSVVLQAGWIKKEVLCRGVSTNVASCR